MFYYAVRSRRRNDSSMTYLPELAHQDKISTLSIILFLGPTVGKIYVCLAGT